MGGVSQPDPTEADPWLEVRGLQTHQVLSGHWAAHPDEKAMGRLQLLLLLPSSISEETLVIVSGWRCSFCSFCPLVCWTPPVMWWEACFLMGSWLVLGGG